MYVRSIYKLSERAFEKIRVEAFRALLVQRVDFFDRFKANELAALVAAELASIRGVLTDNTGRDRGALGGPIFPRTRAARCRLVVVQLKPPSTLTPPPVSCPPPGLRAFSEVMATVGILAFLSKELTPVLGGTPAGIHNTRRRRDREPSSRQPGSPSL